MRNRIIRLIKIADILDKAQLYKEADIVTRIAQSILLPGDIVKFINSDYRGKTPQNTINYGIVDMVQEGNSVTIGTLAGMAVKNLNEIQKISANEIPEDKKDVINKIRDIVMKHRMRRQRDTDPSLYSAMTGINYLTHPKHNENANRTESVIYDRLTKEITLINDTLDFMAENNKPTVPKDALDDYWKKRVEYVTKGVTNSSFGVTNSSLRDLDGTVCLMTLMSMAQAQVIQDKIKEVPDVPSTNIDDLRYYLRDLVQLYNRNKFDPVTGDMDEYYNLQIALGQQRTKPLLDKLRLYREAYADQIKPIVQDFLFSIPAKIPDTTTEVKRYIDGMNEFAKYFHGQYESFADKTGETGMRSMVGAGEWSSGALEPLLTVRRQYIDQLSELQQMDDNSKRFLKKLDVDNLLKNSEDA